ncbi:ATP synthase F1 subunit gamma [Silvibacterium dinghuense]|uniref:ATP synthase gamma chain n=1 Tax=Silvibacterium dinghuense TaxID=1560006 RepID=A0A4V1NVE7_9BACT|nr:ATP synthase F1 subunit gamma [Silvibacterium dinghuense]RXS95510.1 ATP synthase F1 subunit gamma [Silvibacterium dinghuense]GGH13667.1 ATP synthase gamma chain [Silvibacterium dinghuense]
MANVLDLRRRIRSVKNTRQITKAMKMVAAAKLRRAQERAMSSRPYSAMLASVLESLKRRIDTYDPETGDTWHALLRTREEKRVLVVVISGEKGFAGAFNNNILKAASQFIAANQDKQIDIEPIGRKARDTYRRRYPAASFKNGAEGERAERQRGTGIELIGDHTGLLEKLNFDAVREVGEDIVERYAHEEIDAVYVVYNEFKSVIAQRVVVEKILPIVEIGKPQIAQAEEMSTEERARAGEAALTAGISAQKGEAAADLKEFEDEAKKFGTADVDYIYEQSPREIFNAILPRYITSQLYHAMLESVAAEHAARMTAMDAATNNASEMIDSLTLVMNRVRQAAITKEIIEIVSGAAAL